MVGKRYTLRLHELDESDCRATESVICSGRASPTKGSKNWQVSLGRNTQSKCGKTPLAAKDRGPIATPHSFRVPEPWEATNILLTYGPQFLRASICKDYIPYQPQGYFKRETFPLIP